MIVNEQGCRSCLIQCQEESGCWRLRSMWEGDQSVFILFRASDVSLNRSNDPTLHLLRLPHISNFVHKILENAVYSCQTFKETLSWTREREKEPELKWWLLNSFCFFNRREKRSILVATIKEFANAAVNAKIFFKNNLLCVSLTRAFTKSLQRLEEFEPHVGYPSFALLFSLNGVLVRYPWFLLSNKVGSGG